MSTTTYYLYSRPIDHSYELNNSVIIYNATMYLSVSIIIEQELVTQKP